MAYQAWIDCLQKNLTIHTPDDLKESAKALMVLLEALEHHGLDKMAYLDVYFGNVSRFYEKELSTIEARYKEKATFLQTLITQMVEEMEAHFEQTELYEDEEFEQCEADLQAIKRHYSELLHTQYAPKLEALFQTLLHDLKHHG